MTNRRHSGRPRKAVGLMAVAAVAVAAWLVGRDRPVPPWLEGRLLPALAWVVLALVALLVVDWIRRRRRDGARSSPSARRRD